MKPINVPRLRSKSIISGRTPEENVTAQVENITTLKRRTLSVPEQFSSPRIREKSPRQCELCGQVKYTILSSPRNSSVIPNLTRTCEACLIAANNRGK